MINKEKPCSCAGLYNVYNVGSRTPVSRSMYPPLLKRLAEGWESSIKRAYEVTENFELEAGIVEGEFNFTEEQALELANDHRELGMRT